MTGALTVLSAGAIRHSVAKVVQLFERAGNGSVTTDFTPASKVLARVLAGEAVDVVIASAPELDTLTRQSKIVAASRAVVGRTRMAVMMRKGAVAPDLADTSAFRRALLGADVLVYNEGASGAHAASVVDSLGLRAEMGPKIRVARSGAELTDLVASQDRHVLGLAQLTNIFDQVEQGFPVALAGLFPAEIQNVTSYELAVSAGSRSPELAGTLVRAFASPEAVKLLAAAGLD